MKRLDPVYKHRLARGKIIFDAGDVRSTIDDDLLEKGSTCAQRADSLRRELLGMLGNVPAITFKMPCNVVAQRGMEARERDRTDEGHIYTSKTSLGFLTVNLSNFARGRKCTCLLSMLGFSLLVTTEDLAHGSVIDTFKETSFCSMRPLSSPTTRSPTWVTTVG